MIATDMFGQPLETGDAIAYSQPQGAGSRQQVAFIIDIEYRRPRLPSDGPGRTKTLRCEPDDAYYFYLTVTDVLLSRGTGHWWGKQQPIHDIKTRQLRVVENIIKPDRDVVMAHLKKKGVA